MSFPTSQSWKRRSQPPAAGWRSPPEDDSSVERAQLKRLRERLRVAPRLLLERRRSTLDRAGARLQALSPLATLDRGYAIVRFQSEVLRTAAAVKIGDTVEVQLASGALDATVDGVRS